MKYPKMDWGRMEAVVNMLGGEDGVSRFLDKQLVIVDPASKKGAVVADSMFAFSGIFHVDGTKEFVAKQHYVLNTAEDARVRISYLGDNPKKHLLSKVERDITSHDLKLQKLRRPQIDLPKNPEEPGTIFGLGGLDKANVGLYGFFETLAHKQAIGDLTWTVGFAYDDNGVLWTLYAYWYGDGWGVEALSPSYPSDWRVGLGFVSR